MPRCRSAILRRSPLPTRTGVRNIWRPSSRSRRWTASTARFAISRAGAASTPKRSSPTTRPPRGVSWTRSTAPSSCTMPAPSSPTAASSAWARRSASRPTACMRAGRSAWSSSRPTRTSCAARAPCAHESWGVISAHHPMPGVPRDTTRRIGLLGGSFNPAHDGHRHVSLEALKRLDLDEVWWLVSPQNPLKSDDGMEPLASRLARAKLIAHHTRIKVEAPELLLGTRYTLDTVRALQQVYPHAHFVWLMGADILPQLVDWQGWRELFAAIPIAAFARPGWSYAALQSAAPRAFARYRIAADRARLLASCPPPAWCFIPSRLDSHSATAIRAVRPPRTRAKGKTISDQNPSAPARALPDRGKSTDAQLALVRRSL